MVFYELLLMLKMFICTLSLISYAVQCLSQCIFLIVNYVDYLLMKYLTKEVLVI